MKTKALVFAVIATCLSSTAFAQTYDYRDRVELRDRVEQRERDDYRDRVEYRDRYERPYGARDERYDRADFDRRDRYERRRHRAEGAGPHQDLFVGMRLPQEYWDGSHKVRNWRRAGLSSPLPGTNWHRIGNDFVMSSVSTGRITGIILD